MKAQKVRLPYIDNAKAIGLTLAINLGVVFLFFRSGATFGTALVDSAICAVTTTIINLLIVYPRLKKLRAGGQLPAQVPVSRLMQKLPRNPFALGAVFALVFGALTVGINGLILWFFGMEEMAFVPWLTYKLLYATVLSVQIVAFCIFRYVQPDWAGEGTTETQVKNPLPKISVFKEMWGGVTMNIAMNIIIGSLLGGVVLVEYGEVLIFPTTVEGISITGLVFGLIVGVLTTNGVTRAMKGIILQYGAAAGGATSKWFSWLPKRKVWLSALICVCTMLFSAVALPTVMRLFGMTVMNFYQFSVFITIYATLVGKPISYVLTRRCLQPDYIEHILKKGGKENV
ncbi:MAG: hypothetical protein FWE69_02690 [Clostridiales bacterium]|nr:hypothetical protein [Clostridiales bacterium]